MKAVNSIVPFFISQSTLAEGLSTSRTEDIPRTQLYPVDSQWMQGQASLRNFEIMQPMEV